MDEAERLCDRVAIMDHGKVIALGTPRELVASIGAEHMVEFSADQLDASTLPSLEGVLNMRQANGTVQPRKSPNCTGQFRLSLPS